MKNLPKSKIGALFAGLYLLVVFILLFQTFYGGGGLHGSAAMAFIFLLGITLPVSSVGFMFPDEIAAYLIFLSVVAGALVNALAIYFIGWVLSYFSKSIGGQSG